MLPKTFVIEVRSVSDKNENIQSAKLNGQALDKQWFEHAEIVKGGNLTLEMGPRPNKKWGDRYLFQDD
jgi:putative alpha-1,2-mannosidase